MVLSLWRKNGHKAEMPEIPAAVQAAPAHAAPKRDKQLNLKVSEACKRVFAQIAQAQGLSAAALFEDMVAERAEQLANAGHLEVS